MYILDSEGFVHKGWSGLSSQGSYNAGRTTVIMNMNSKPSFLRCTEKGLGIKWRKKHLLFKNVVLINWQNIVKKRVKTMELLIQRKPIDRWIKESTKEIYSSLSIKDTAKRQDNSGYL